MPLAAWPGGIADRADCDWVCFLGGTYPAARVMPLACELAAVGHHDPSGIPCRRPDRFTSRCRVGDDAKVSEPGR